jgi:TonB-dependent SusC/RagA subfamily outer membrane receptor
LEVKGKVTDLNGDPLPGVTVVLKGSATGTITGADGTYVLNNVPADGTLIFSFVGMRSQEIAVAGNRVVDARLEEETIGIEEVVAIGYGTAKKGDLTGAVASVQGEKLLSRSTQQISTAMQGQMAGVQVTRSSGAPGASATVRIRGITTLSNNDPLVIVDGVPSSLNDVVTSDVETMTVLKDAASASIYGSRAAAGVILITTKRAKDHQFSFDYNYEYALDKPTTQPKNGDVIDWMNVQNEVKWNDGAADPYSQYSQETIGDGCPECCTGLLCLQGYHLGNDHNLRRRPGYAVPRQPFAVHRRLLLQKDQ